MFEELRDEHGLQVDLLYGAPTWHILMPWLVTEGKSILKGKKVMYYNSGGMEGVSSQMKRYQIKGMIGREMVQ